MVRWSAGGSSGAEVRPNELSTDEHGMGRACSAWCQETANDGTRGPAGCVCCLRAKKSLHLPLCTGAHRPSCGGAAMMSDASSCPLPWLTWRRVCACPGCRQSCCRGGGRLASRRASGQTWRGCCRWSWLRRARGRRARRMGSRGGRGRRRLRHAGRRAGEMRWVGRGRLCWRGRGCAGAESAR